MHGKASTVARQPIMVNLINFIRFYSTQFDLIQIDLIQLDLNQVDLIQFSARTNTTIRPNIRPIIRPNSSAEYVFGVAYYSAE